MSERLTAEGNFTAVIVNSYPIERPGKDGEDSHLCIKFELETTGDANGKSVEIQLDMSENYVGSTGKRSIDMSLETLSALGIGAEIAKLDTLKGKIVQIYGKKAGTKEIVYYRFSFEKKVDLNTAQSRLQAMLGKSPAPAGTNGQNAARDPFQAASNDSKIPF